jgi:hypothetical protein
MPTITNIIDATDANNADVQDETKSLTRQRTITSKKWDIAQKIYLEC